MKRFAVGLSLVLLSVAACNGDDDPPAGACEGDALECVVPWDCPVGETCDATVGCCVEFGCVPGECEAGTFCNGDTKACEDIGTACLSSPNGCECHILNPAGEFEASDIPTITLAANATYELQAVLAVVGGDPLPGATFDFSVAPGTLFSAAGTTLTASGDATGGTGETLTATSGSYAPPCTADLVHLGAPTAGEVRFFVFDDATAQPVAGVQVVIDDETTSVTTDINGIASVTQPVADFTVSAFKTGYNYLSVVGIPQATNDIALPMAHRPAAKTTAGFTGKADFEDYERRVLGGKPKTIKFGIVSTSFQLSSLLNFDLDLLIGPIASPDEGCDYIDPVSGNHPAGCYEVSIPGLVDEPIWTALPGGILLALASNPIKSHFDVVGAPGRRYAWSLGGEVEVSDISGLINLVTGFLGSCDCDTSDACDMNGQVECDCDSDCGLALDFGGLFNSLTPLFSMFASGVEGNISMVGVPYATWEGYIATDYSDRMGSDFELLDTAGRGKLAIREPLQVFTDFTLGALPEDPGSENDMEGVVVLSGVNTTGFGFVPLGLGAGLDCTTDKCLDRDGEGADDYDGVVDGGLMCFFDPDPELNGCPPGVPHDELPDGHLGLFHAKAHGGLQGQEFLTISLALPITALADGDAGIRVAAIVARGEPAAGASNTLAGAYPTFPTSTDSQPADSFAVTGNSDSNVHWVTIATEEDDDGMTTRWNIYYPGTGATFTAPDPTLFGVTIDPFDPLTGSGTDVINATHVSFKAPGVSLTDLVENDGTNLNNLLDDVDGFTVTSKDVTVIP